MVFAVFWPVTDSEFVRYDDQNYITENIHVSTGLSPENLTWAFTTGHAGYWQPVTWLSLMTDAQVWGLDARGFHLTNLILHAANAGLLFLVLQAMTGALWRSALAAALFAIHPLHVESVAWVVERKDVLSTFFGVLAIAAWVRHRRRQAPGMHFAAFVLLLLSLMAKPMLVTLPLVLLLLDAWPLGRIFARTIPEVPGGPARRLPALRLIREKSAFFVAAAVFSVVAFEAQRRGGAMTSLNHLPILAKVGNAVISCVRYLARTLMPQDLAFFYPYPIEGWPWWLVILSATLLAAITAAVIMLRRPAVAMGWCWYLVTLLPVIGLVQVGAQAMADRFTYVPLVGVFVAVSWGLGELTLAWPRLRKPVVAGALVCLVTLMVLARGQVNTWHDSLRLFQHAIDVTRGNWVVHLNLGDYWADRGSLEDAAREYRAALEVNPDFAQGHNSLGVNLARMGRLDEAMDEFNRALTLDHGLADAYFNLGMALAVKEMVGEAIRFYSRGLEIAPGQTRARLELVELLAKAGRREEAERHFRESVKRDPGRLETTVPQRVYRTR